MLQNMNDFVPNSLDSRNPLRLPRTLLALSDTRCCIPLYPYTYFQYERKEAKVPLALTAISPASYSHTLPGNGGLVNHRGGIYCIAVY